MAGASDHASWGFGSDEARAATVTHWLAVGLALGQRAFYVGEATADDLLHDLEELDGRDELLERGALVLMTYSDVYDMSAPIDADAQLAAYDAVLQQALSDGYGGLCVAADITPLVEDPTRRTAHVHWEQVADRYITENPVSPVCIYDTRRVDGLDAISCVHPVQHPVEEPFTLHAVSKRRAALRGEVDGCVADVLEQVLQTMPPTDEIDVAGLRFIDGHGAWSLHEALHQRGDSVVLRNPPAQLRRVWRLCGLDPAPLV
jgi:hypothetical protein